jgi:hypothetical protein|tara:strand:- start:2 stop:259 length:258 start_codon:yes stop_codon:yes gene_type:complete
MPVDYDSIPTGKFPEETDLDQVYILYDHIGGMIAVYGDGDRAIERAVDEITKDYEYDTVHVDIFDWAIMVRSNIGEITILIEKIY